MERKVVIVTGASSGIGKETAKVFAQKNFIVYDFSRRDITTENINHMKVDVTNEENVQNAIAAVYQKEGRIDIVVNCAGYGISGAVEFTVTKDAQNQFNVNFFGTVNVNKAVIPFMRKQKYGRIVNISSVAAVAHIPFQTYYSASKAAIESYTNALANEIRPFGITVTAISPGDICTDFTGARQKSFDGDDIYEGRILKSVSSMEKDEKNGMSPVTAAEYIVKISLQKNVKPVYTIGAQYKFLSVLCKVFPCSFRNRIVGMLYAK